MSQNSSLALAIALVPCALLAQVPPAAAVKAPASREALPVKRVVLYKNGVGYFEHLGRISASQTVGVNFTSGQLNDVLKSLTVLDMGGGRITGVTYGSSAPVDRQFGDLRLPVGEKPSLTEFLGAMRGARIEVRSGTNVISGRLLSVERKTRISGGTTLEVDYLSLVTDAGELRTTELSPQFSVKLLDTGLPGKVDRYLDLISTAREADVRRMNIATEGSGERPLFVSYISEVPVWKATYRIVLDPAKGKQPLLQGWAIVDNTVGQDWEKVELSLVAGAPQSFIQNLSLPYYARRPVVPLPESMTGMPQTYEATLIPGGGRLTGQVTDPTGAALSNASVKAYGVDGALVGSAFTNNTGNYNLNVPPGSVRLQFEAPGFRSTTINGVQVSPAQAATNNVMLQVGSVAESIEVSASAASLNTSSAQISVQGRNLGSGRALGGGGRTGGVPGGVPGGVAGGRLAMEPGVSIAAVRDMLESAANAQALGDLFEYKLKEPVTIRKNESALVPIVHAGVSADKISIWNSRLGRARPQRALWLTNSTGLTLDGGTFSVLEQETFAGEGVFEPIRPGEKRIIAYASDLALNAAVTDARGPSYRVRLVVARGVMTWETETRETKTYTFRNEDDTERSVVVEHPVRHGYELRGGTKPVETTAAMMRFRLPVAPKQTANLVVEEALPDLVRTMITDIDSDQIAAFVKDRTITPEIEAALRRVVEQGNVVEGFERDREAKEAEVTKIYDDQQRLRENVKALKGSVEEKALLQRYLQQLNQQETRLEALNREIQEAKAKEDAAESALEDLVQSLTFDVKL